jgi:hypothetical protein
MIFIFQTNCWSDDSNGRLATSLSFLRFRSATSHGKQTAGQMIAMAD